MIFTVVRLLTPCGKLGAHPSVRLDSSYVNGSGPFPPSLLAGGYLAANLVAILVAERGGAYTPPYIRHRSNETVLEVGTEFGLPLGAKIGRLLNKGWVVPPANGR